MTDVARNIKMITLYLLNLVYLCGICAHIIQCLKEQLLDLLCADSGMIYDVKTDAFHKPHICIICV